MPPGIAEELEEIRRQRDSRDIKIFRNALLPAAISLKKYFNEWRTEELRALRKERGLLVSAASTPEAKSQLNGVEVELNQIENERVPQARQNLETFIAKLQKKSMKNPEEVGNEVGENLLPTVKLIGDLYGIRKNLDAMAAMIPH